MSLAALFAAATMSSVFQSAPPSEPLASALAATVSRGQAAQVDDVVVQSGRLRGLSIQDQAALFVDEVAAPASRRGLARWSAQGRMCVGVVNARNDVAHAVADHVSRMAVDVGLKVGDPGCQPNVVIIFTDDPNGVTTGMVDQYRRAFHLGVGGLDRGGVALREFKNNDLPVRWWHVSMPVNGVTKEQAIRMPGDEFPPHVRGEGLVNTGRYIADLIFKAVVVVDVNQVASTPLPQLADYIGMVTLLQVDPDGDTRPFETILNLFDNPDASHGLSSWDRSYLESLYDAYSERINRHDQSSAMARGIIRAERIEAREASPQP